MMSRSPLLLLTLATFACSKTPAQQAADARARDSAAIMTLEADAKTARPPASQIPSDLVPVAIAATGKIDEKCSGMLGSCKDYRVAPDSSRHFPLTPADRANGYEDTYCVTVAFLQRRGPSSPWYNGSASLHYVKKAGAWESPYRWSGEQDCYFR